MLDGESTTSAETEFFPAIPKGRDETPASEATIGNVGKKPGTSGWVDFIMTPAGGFAFTVTEDAVDKHIICKMKDGGTGGNKLRMYRSFLNPERSLANLLRLKAPWHRDTRAIPE